MSIQDGQAASADNFNAAFASKSSDNTLTGKLTLNRTGSGSQVTDAQQAINDRIPLSQKGAANGVAPLNASSQIDLTYIPGTNPADGSVTPAKLSTGGPSWDTSGNLQFNSGYGSTATAYGCRAWVNFDQTSNTANLTGTYSQSGTTVTVTVTNHGLIQGQIIYSDITSGTGVDGVYTVASVTSSNVFTYTAGTSLTTSGNITLIRNTIRTSGNISSISDNGTGDFTVNFTTAMPDTNYSFTWGCRGNDTNTSVVRCIFPISTNAKTVNAFRCLSTFSVSGSWGLADYPEVNLAFFR